MGRLIFDPAPHFFLDFSEKEVYPETMARNGKRNGKKNGRPTKISDALIEKVCGFIEEGNFIDTAAVCAGIHYCTYYNWIKWGDRRHQDFKGGQYEVFFKAVKNAERRAERSILLDLYATKGMAWTKFAWVLERRFPAKWGRRFQQLPASQQEDGVKGIEQAQEALRNAQGDPDAVQGAEAMTKFLRMNGESTRPN